MAVLQLRSYIHCEMKGLGPPYSNGRLTVVDEGYFVQFLEIRETWNTSARVSLKPSALRYVPWVLILAIDLAVWKLEI
jgi:hypothetical protein